MSAFDQFVYLSDLFGTAVFAFSGVLVAGRLRMDGFGVTVLAAVTAVGGGTLRDLILGADPVFWVKDTNYLWIIIATSLIGMGVTQYYHRLPRYVLPLADAFGLALFTVIGAHKALVYGAPDIVAILMGIMTGSFGGMIRDVLAREIPMVLQKEVYATACLFGGVLYIAANAMHLDHVVAMVIGMIGVFVLRVAAIYWNLSLPTFDSGEHDEAQQ